MGRFFLALANKRLHHEEREDCHRRTHHQNQNEGADVTGRIVAVLLSITLPTPAIYPGEQVNYDHDDEGGDEELNQIAHLASIARGLV